MQNDSILFMFLRFTLFGLEFCMLLSPKPHIATRSHYRTLTKLYKCSFLMVLLRCLDHLSKLKGLMRPKVQGKTHRLYYRLDIYLVKLHSMQLIHSWPRLFQQTHGLLNEEMGLKSSFLEHDRLLSLLLQFFCLK